MGKEIVSSTPGQAHEAYLQIEKAMKGAGKTDLYEAMKELLKNKVFEKAVTEHFTGKYAAVSEKFTATEISVSTKSSKKTYNVKKDIKELLATKEEGGLFDYRDNDIINWFGNVNFTPDKPAIGKVQRFRQNIAHRDIIAEGQKLGVYQEYDIVEALLLAGELVKAGAIEEKGKGIIIYLSNKKDGVSCRLDVWRNDDGFLEVGVRRVDPDRECGAGRGVLFSN